MGGEAGVSELNSLLSDRGPSTSCFFIYKRTMHKCEPQMRSQLPTRSAVSPGPGLRRALPGQ